MQTLTTFEITPEIRKQLLETYSPRTFKVKSKDTGKEYCITLAKSHFTCGCPSWNFKARNPDGSMKRPFFYCKHMKQLALELLGVNDL